MMFWDWRWFVVPGSALCVLPLVLLFGAALWPQVEARQAVLRWWAAVAVGVLLAAGSKIAFYGWGTGVRAWDLTCFSGHTVLGFSLWPVAMAVLVPPRHRRTRWLAILAGVAFATLIAISRVKLRAHPVSEVVAGVMLGGVVAAVGLRALRARYLAPRATIGVFALVILFALGCQLAERRFPMLPSERWMAEVGSNLAGRSTPVDRQRWRNVTSHSPDVTPSLSR